LGAPERSAEIARLIRSGGGRMTASRRALIDELLQEHRHATADELIDRVQAVIPTVDRSTVYRNLAFLESVGIVYHVHLAHGPSVYHLVDASPHAHVVCAACGSAAEVATQALDALSSELEQSHGFRLDRQHFALTGVCRRCRANNADCQ
jgi:Fur family ferric uptake transcriptional regulator